MIKDRNAAQENLSGNKSDENLQVLKKLRNNVAKSLRKDKIKWQKKKLEDCTKDPGKLWKNILGWFNWCSSGAPSKLYHAGQMVTSPARLADIMNNFFVNKIASIREGLPNPLRTLQNFLKDRTEMLSLSAVHPDAVRKIILGLKNS